MQMHVYASIHIYIYMYLHVYVRVYIYIEMYVCTCEFIGVQVKGYVGMSSGMQVYARIHADMLDSALRVWVQWWGLI